MEDHFECLWDLYRSIPSLEIEGASVLDEFYWLNKDDPNFSLQRATVNRGEDAHTDGAVHAQRAGAEGDRSSSSSPPARRWRTSASTRYSGRNSSQ